MARRGSVVKEGSILELQRKTDAVPEGGAAQKTLACQIEGLETKVIKRSKRKVIKR